MIRMILAALLFLNGVVFAEKPVGFLWYTKEKAAKKVEKKVPPGTSFKNLRGCPESRILRLAHQGAVKKMNFYLSAICNSIVFDQVQLH